MRTGPICVLVLCACGETDVRSVDQGAPDLGTLQPDLGSKDTGPADQGVPDLQTADQGQAEDLGVVDTGPADLGAPDLGSPDLGAPPAFDPVLFVHGVNGSSLEFDLMRQRLVDDGWPATQLYAFDFEDPAWGCNIDNANAIAMEVMRILAETGAQRIDLVAHSMGTLSSRYFIKNLGGDQLVNTYVTLGGLHHGNRLACLNPLDVCVWQELCPNNPFLMQLNADPATPGDLAWVSIYSTDDGVVPTDASMLDGAENIEVTGVPHAGAGGLTEDEGVYAEVMRVLLYPPW